MAFARAVGSQPIFALRRFQPAGMRKRRAIPDGVPDVSKKTLDRPRALGPIAFDK